MNIGAGRVVLQDLPRINAALADGGLGRQPVLRAMIETLAGTGGACHLIGLMSPGGVHAHQDHIGALARVIAGAGIPVRVHALLDGRDTPPRSAAGYVSAFETSMADLDRAAIATVGGRYWGMDRDNRWDRVARAYDVLVAAEGPRADSAAAAIAASYADDVGDEFVTPHAIGDFSGMADGDGLLMANFRADRAREILTALVDPAFDEFDRRRRVDFAARVGMTAYSSALSERLETIFPPFELHGTLGETVARAGRRQLRIAETEKYAHVTFFLNGGRETVYPGEERILVPSPKVATYDLRPEMSAPEVTDKLAAAIEGDRFDLIVVNFANTDMVGHTGVLAAAIDAVAAVDRCLGRIAAAVEAAGGALLITSDHGNAEQMADPASGDSHTAHTVNPVPLVAVGVPGARLAQGRLADLAPTLLALMGLVAPNEMTGTSLIEFAETGSTIRRESRAGAYDLGSETAGLLRDRRAGFC